MAGAGDCYYMPVTAKSSMVTIGANGMSERQGWRGGLYVSREQWNPTAIPTILTIWQRPRATTTNPRNIRANGTVLASGPSARPGPSIIAGETTHEGFVFCADGVCREAQVSCHLAGTAELSRPGGNDAERVAGKFVRKYTLRHYSFCFKEMEAKFAEFS